MVGVPGKYKGCNTCRLRRVKCDNKRPHCRKCIDSGRECVGYERQRVFIIGTPLELGRCSSHPRRNVSGRGQRKASTQSRSDQLEPPEEPGVARRQRSLEAAIPMPDGQDYFVPVPTEPLRSAWEDLVSVTCSGVSFNLQIASLNTELSSVVRSQQASSVTNVETVSLPQYAPPDTRRSMREAEFKLRSQCLAHISDVEEVRDDTSGKVINTDSICLFLFENNWSVIPPSLPPWVQDPTLSRSVKQLGPEKFKAFPAHHFFARVYRPNAIFAALVNRKSTFLSTPAWTSVPWELHPKSAIDRLLDVVVLVPALLSRADQILPHGPTLERRLLVQDLLGNCLSVQGLLTGWLYSFNHEMTSDGSLVPRRLCWTEQQPLMNLSSNAPFTEGMYGFADLQTAMSMIYYWAALVTLVPCIECLSQVMYQAVPEAFPQLFPEDFCSMMEPSSLPINLTAPLLSDAESFPLTGGGSGGGRGDGRGDGKDVRRLADGICKSLNFALARSVQPDLLAAPLGLAEEYYRGINITTGDAALELLWCDAFRLRLTAKGQDLADVVQERSWRDLGHFGP